MVKLLSEALFEKYAKLWNRYGIKGFSFNDAKALFRFDDNHTRVTLHRLKNEDVLLVQREKRDSRIKQYRVLSPMLWVQEKLLEAK